VLVAVVVVCLGVLTWLYVSDTDDGDSAGARLASLVTGEGRGGEDDQLTEARAREAVLAQATQYVLRINAFGPGDLDAQNQLTAYRDRVHEVVTPKLRASFDQGVLIAEAQVSQAGFGRESRVVAAGVVSMSADEAIVLASVEIRNTYPDPQDPEQRLQDLPQLIRYQLQMRKIDGTWLADVDQKVSDTVPDPDAVQEPTAPVPSSPVPSSPAPSTSGAPS
jgi:Mce-associated membrane protein